MISDINKISNKLNFKKVIDLRYTYAQINYLNKKIKYSLNFKKNKNEINILIKKFEELGKTIKNKILKYGSPYTIFCKK